MAARRIEAVIWDFNGTLVDDLQLVVKTVNAQLRARSLAPLTEETYREVFGFPVEDYYRRIGVTFEDESMADLSAAFFAEYAPALRGCRLHDDVPRTLETLERRGIRQFVLSAMEEGMLREMIDHFGIGRFFEGVYGLAHQEADSKLSRGEELLRDLDIRRDTAFLIGDTAHDADVAQGLGIDVILIARGHQSTARLRATGVRVAESAGSVPALLEVEGQDREEAGRRRRRT